MDSIQKVDFVRSKIMLLMAVIAALVGCGSRYKAVEDIPQYSNDIGEEVFGPGYRPTSPSIESVPLKIGTPNAGYKVSARLRDYLHEDLLDTQDIASPASTGGASSIPVLKKFASQVDRASGGDTTDSSTDAGSANETSSTPVSPANSSNPAVMTVHYVFVGQGDGAIVEFPCGVALIDTGGEFGGGTRVNGGRVFVDYLTEFFADRPHLNDTIDLVISTHPHADHVNGLPLLVDDDGDLLFEVRNVVDNGQTGDSGSMGKQTTFRRLVDDSGGSYSAVEMARQVAATGATNDVIDPFVCDDVDPVITVFWGGLNEELPSDELLSESEYSTPNNHSVIVRIDFGDASFLFTGDLEDRGERDLREQYEDNLEVFDVDVYQVSHHGADDDTSDELLEIMTPNIAVISMGTPEHQGRFTAFDHGHPRTGLLAVLQDEPGVVFDERDPPMTFLAAPEQETTFEDTLITKAIFGTGWEGTILIEANTRGEYEIYTE
jgi:hypothetical protein